MKVSVVPPSMNETLDDSVKDKILLEVQRLFWRYGVRSITMDDIARRLGISKKTIYQHFTDKEDIVLQVVGYHLTNNLCEVDKLIASADNPVEEMLLISDMMCRQTDSVNPSVMVDIQRYYPKAWDAFLTYKENHIIKDVKASLQQGVDQGFYRTDLDLETMARLRVELIQLGFDERIFPHATDMLLIQEQLLHHFVRGMLTEKGFTAYNKSINKLKRIQSDFLYEQ